MIITKTKKLLLLGVAVVVIGGGAGAYLYANRSSNQPDTTTTVVSNIDYSPGTKADKANSEDSKDGPSQPSSSGTTPSGTSTIAAQITGANVQTDNVHIGTLVSGTTTGNCTLTGTKNGTTIALGTSTVMQSVNTYSCGVFNISPKTFPSSGVWELALSVTSNAETAKGTYEVTIP